MPAYSLADILGITEQLQPKPKIRSARSQNRAAAWSYDLEQWRQYRLAMATADAQRVEIEREYATRVAAGPDFTGYHAHSDFSAPPVHKLDQAGARTVLKAFDELTQWLYRNMREPRGQAVSLRYREVLRLLLNCAIRRGTVYPSHAWIAAQVRCCVRTVQNALAWLKLFGFLTWQRRLTREPGRLGTVVRQTSNAYRLLLSGLAAVGAKVIGIASNNCIPSRLDRSPLQVLAQEKAGAG